MLSIFIFVSFSTSYDKCGKRVLRWPAFFWPFWVYGAEFVDCLRGGAEAIGGFLVPLVKEGGRGIGAKLR
jgi:hypothetical protein